MPIDVTKQPSPRSLVLELLSALGAVGQGAVSPGAADRDQGRRDLGVQGGGTDDDDALPVAALLRAGALYGYDEGAIRVALSRLRKRGLVSSPRRGEYQLDTRGRALAEHVQGWRRAPRAVVGWRGGWIGVATGGLPRVDRRSTRARERALSLFGFRELRPSLHVRPDNLRLPLPQLRERLRGVSLEPSAPVFALSELGAQDPEARALWDGAGLDEACRSLTAEVESLLTEMPAVSWDEGARRSFLVGGAVLRHFAYEPLLPAPIVDVGLRDALVDAMLRLDEVGRECWRETLLSREAA